MATKPERDVAAENGRPTRQGPAGPGPSVIRHVQVADEGNRMMTRHLPAFALSGLFHLVFMTIFTLLFYRADTPQAEATQQVIDTIVDDEQEEDFNLINEDLGFDADLEAAVDVEREEIANVEAPVDPSEPIGIDAPDNVEMPIQTVAPPGALTDSLTAGVMGDTGMDLSGTGGMAGQFISPGMRGRSGATKDAMLKAGGGNSMSEAAVARGLAWLAQQQRPTGNWVYDGSAKDDVSATGMALLPFLAAGETHKSGKKYARNVAAGITFLVSRQKADGNFTGIKNMYSSAIAALALAEAYGMTRDPVLKPRAQAGLNYLMKAQATNGSWGYSAGNPGDTSIVGWAVQALKSGKLSKLIVDDRVMDRARSFLEEVSSDSGAKYGYRAANTASPTRSAVGLLCRIYIDNWGPQNPSLARGVEYMLRSSPNKGKFDMYFYYYATQVVHFFGGTDWHQKWNPAMRDMLIDLQEKAPGPELGSWKPDQTQIGSNCGRLGTTCLCLLTLEVYYRYLPTYKRDGGGLAELER